MAEQIVTVLGGTGFLGSFIVSDLLEAGYRVRIACRHPERATRSQSENAEMVTCDLLDEHSLRQAFEGATAMVNAVALYNERHGLTFDQIHVQGAGRAARCAQDMGVERQILFSGIGASTASASKYVRARAQGEAAVREAFRDTIIVRPSTLCDQHAGFVSALEMVTTFPVIPLFGQGKTRLQPVYVGDIARAVRRCIEMPETAGKTFELGGGETYTYRECIDLVLEHQGRKRPKIPLPFAFWHLIAAILGKLPNPPLNQDQVILMENDNVVGRDLGTFNDLGIQPSSLRDVLNRTDY
jgi:uncharacterized protein YbjT (DUF2867 family)